MRRYLSWATLSLRPATKTIGLVLLLAIAASGIAAVIRLRQRSEFRDKLRPVMEEDLSDFAQEIASSGGLMAATAIAGREKRIALGRLYDAGPYRSARGAIVRLMEAENRQITINDEMSRLEYKVPSDLRALQFSKSRYDLALRLGDRASACAAIKDSITQSDDLLADMRSSSTIRERVHDTLTEGASAWNAAYGWIKWLGLDIEPHNPFGSPNEPFELHDHAADLETAEESRSLIVKTKVSLCGGDG